MRRTFLLLVVALACPPPAAAQESLEALVELAEQGRLQARELEILDDVPDDDPAAAAARALVLTDAWSRRDVDRYCPAAERLVALAPAPQQADSRLELARCLILRDDLGAALAAIDDARSQPDGFGGASGPTRGLLAADLGARLLTFEVSERAARGQPDRTATERAMAAWVAVASLADAAGDVVVRNRARRLEGDLSAHRSFPDRPYAYPRAELEKLGEGVGDLLSLASGVSTTADATSPEEATVEELADLGPRGFRDAEWGASPDQVRALEKRRPLTDDGDRLAFEGRLLGREAASVYRFRRDRLHEGAWIITERYDRTGDARDDYEELRVLLRDKYGDLDDIAEEVWSGDGEGGELRALSEGRLTLRSRWSFERTVITLQLSRSDGRFKLRVIYEQADGSRDRQRDQDRRRERERDKL